MEELKNKIITYFKAKDLILNEDYFMRKSRKHRIMQDGYFIYSQKTHLNKFGNKKARWNVFVEIGSINDIETISLELFVRSVKRDKLGE